MADPQSIREIVNQIAVQPPIVVMMAFRDTETGPWPAAMPNKWGNQRQSNRGLVLEKSIFNWNMPHCHVKPVSFQLEMTNILETRAC